MKRIGIVLLLLAMVFAGCEKIKDQVDAVQGGIKSNKAKTIESKSDSGEADTALLGQNNVDTSSIGSSNFPMLNIPYSAGYQYPLYSPLRLDTILRIGDIRSQFQWNFLTKPLWSEDSLVFRSNSSVGGDLYERSN